MASPKPGLGLLALISILLAPSFPEPVQADGAPAASAAADTAVAVVPVPAHDAAPQPAADRTTVTTDSTTFADSLHGNVTVVTTVTTVTRVRRQPVEPAPLAAAGDSALALAPASVPVPDSALALVPASVPEAEPVVADSALAVGATPGAPPPSDTTLAPTSPAQAPKPAEPEPRTAPIVPGPRIALLSNGADPLIVRDVQQLLEKSGATVDVMPLAPVGAGAATLTPSATNGVSASPAAFGLPGRTSAAPSSSSSPAMPIAWEGQLRYRYEARTLLDYRVPGTFGRAATQSLADRGDASIMRTRVGATVKLAPLVRGYFVLQDARTMGAEGSPSGTLQNVDLYHAYVDLDSLGAAPFALRLGRQTLAYGEGRVLSGADWGNAGRAYDAVRARWTPARAQVDGFVAWINEGRVNGQDRLLSGVDALWKWKPGHELEAYHFRRAFGDAAWTSESGRKGSLMDATSGGRARVVARRLELRGEAATQRGQRASDAVEAWFFVGRATADLRGAWKTKLFAEYLRASGDEDPADGTFQRFDPVYWGGHGFQGALDVAMAANLRDQAAGVSATPKKGWTLQAEGHVFRLDQPRDAWLDDSGNTLRRNSAGAAGEALGREVDVTLKWETRGKVTVLAGASRFFAGDYVRRTGGGADLNWGFLQLAVGF